MSTTIKGEPAAAAYTPSDDQTVAYLQAHAIYGETLRYKDLDRREAFFRCQQYAHQQKDWEGRDADSYETISPDVVFSPGTGPTENSTLMARDKRPTAPTNIARTVVKRYTGLLFSEQRKPKVRIEQDPETEAFLEAVREAAKFWPTMRAARDLAGAMGSVVVTVGLRNGKFSYEVHNAKNVTPIWDDRRMMKLSGILIMWKFPKEENIIEPDGKFVGTRVVDYLYRRIITAQQDTIYEEIKLEDAARAGWVPAQGQQVAHALGFFPGVWVQNHADSQEFDGDADCEGAWQTIDTNDRLIAQMHSGVLRNCDPTLVTKTDPMEMAKVEVMQKGSDHGIEVGSKGDAKYLEITGAGIQIGMELSAGHKQTICDITGVVLIDDKDMAAAQSAKAIEFRFAPMIERADDLRAQFGEAVVDLSRITERTARAFLAQSVALPALADGVPRIGKFRFELPPRKVDGLFIDHKLGPGGYISLEWGAYFSPTEDDNQRKIQNATAANAGSLIDKVTAARSVAPIFGVQDVEQVVALAKAEGDAEASRMMGAGFGGGVLPGDEEQTPAAGAGGRP